jgi:hypothetical protein
MRNPILTFLDALDERLVSVARPGEYLDLYLIGRSALMLRHQRQGVGTDDVDAVWLRESALEERAVELFGAGSASAKTLGLYLELVPQGLPPMPAGFRRRCKPYPGAWKVIRVFEPDPNDLAVTKLKRFEPKDRVDLQFLCDQGLLNLERVEAYLHSAWTWTTDKDGDEQRDRAFANFRRLRAYSQGESGTL